MFRTLAFALLALGALLASAEDPAPAKPKAKAAIAPRPGMRWVDQAPEVGPKSVALLLRGKDSIVYELAPGGEIRVAVPGENRLLVHARLEFESRTAKAAGYSFTWKLDETPEAKVRFRSAPHKTAQFVAKDEAVPGTYDSLLIEVPAQGLHEVTIRMAKEAKGTITLRFFIEQAKRVRGADNGASNKPSDHRHTWWMGTTSKLRMGYDDNVWRLSKNDVHEFARHHNDDPNDKFDRMASVDDFYFDSDFDLHIISPEGPLGRVTIGGQVNDRLYFQNHRKNTEEYVGYIRDAVLDSFHYKIFGTISPDHFVRNLDPQEVPGVQRAHAHYDEYTLGAQVWVRPVKPLAAQFTYTWEFNDWNGSFNERDSKINHFDLGLSYTPWPWVTGSIGYEFTLARALATGEELDTSYLQHELRAGLDFKHKRVLFGASYSYENRRYTTDNAVAIDPDHSGRRDERHLFRVYVGCMLGESTSLIAEYTKTIRKSSLAGNGDANDFSYDSNRLELTFSLKWP